MNRQQKIDRLEKKGKKVRIVYSTAHQGKVVIGNHSFDSVNAAHKHYFGY